MSEPPASLDPDAGTEAVPPSPSDTGSDPMGRVVESFLARFRRGERPALTEYIARHPELADEIRELLPALVEVEQYGSRTGAVGARGDPGAPSPADLRPDPAAPERLGDYRILRMIGGGGMGVVYEAERESLRSRVALKVMHPQFRSRADYLRRFHVEARSAAGLHHTNIVSVFDYGEQDGVCYYAMQYIAGHGLDAILKDVRRLRLGKQDRPGGEEPGDETIAAPSDDPSRMAITRAYLTGRYPPPPAAGQDPAFDDPEPGVDGVRTFAALAATLPNGAAGVPTRGRVRPSIGLPSGSSGDRRPESATGDVSASALSERPEDRFFFREVARIGAQVADALAYAHQRHVLHRDVKPSNLLLDPMGNVWVTDFGLAKFEEGEDLSRSQDLVGTLRYMAPERFRGESGRACDVYALGATLYEMLCLRPAFEGRDQIRLIDRIVHQPPRPLRQVDRRIPRDLETIVHKALAKEPGDRFGTAAELAAELRRFAEHRPIRSRPSPAYEQLWRWCRRNPALASVVAVAATLTLALAVVSTAAAWTFRDQRNEISRNLDRIKKTEAAERTARAGASRALFEALKERARAGRFSRQVGQRFRSLDALAEAVRVGRDLRLPPGEFEPLRDEAIACLALPDLEPTGREFPAPSGLVTAAADEGATRRALRLPDGTVSVRQLVDDAEIARFQARGDRDIWLLEFSPDGRYLVTGHRPDWGITVWDVDRRAVVLEVGPVANQARCARFAPDGRRIAVARGDSEILIYDLTTGRPEARWREPGPVADLAFRSDGTQLALVESGRAPACRIVEADSGRLVRSFPLPSPDSLAWSRDGTLATPGMDRKIYVWDPVAGVRKATLEGLTNSGLHASFHPTGTLLASDGFEGRLRLWDPTLGRPWLNVNGRTAWPGFGRDGRIFAWVGERMIEYRAEPALEYRSLVHASTTALEYGYASARSDGRVVAAGTDRGVVLWDLAHGAEIAFLPIGKAWTPMFEPSGELLTSGRAGVLRWPVRLDPARGEFRIGPPRPLPLPTSSGAMAQDRLGRVVATTSRWSARVVTPDRSFEIGPLDDCRAVAVSPDGQWLATGTHIASRGAQVWRISDGAKLADLPIDTGAEVEFSPDGRWLAAGPGRLWEVGTWREARRLPGLLVLCFSPDGRMIAAQDEGRVVHLIEVATGRTLARLDSPDQCLLKRATFSPDGSRLVGTTDDVPSTRVWDLRLIRRRLAAMSLDWDAAGYSEDDPAAYRAAPLPPLGVDLGPLEGHMEHYLDPAATVAARYDARLKAHPDDDEAYHHRGHAMVALGRREEAISDFTRALQRRPDDPHLRFQRALSYGYLKRYDPAIADLEEALARRPDDPEIRSALARYTNNRAWELVNGPESTRDAGRALALASRALALEPDRGAKLNTLGLAQYRAGRHAEAIATLRRNLEINPSHADAYDLYVLAMASRRLGRREEARAFLDRAVCWHEGRQGLTTTALKELAAFRAEAEAVLAEPDLVLPADPFARPR